MTKIPDQIVPGDVFERAMDTLAELAATARPVDPSRPDPETELFVDKAQGDDGASGDRGAPIRSFAEMAKRLQPRTRVIISDGYYREPLRLAGLRDRLRGEPVWIKAETPGGVSLTATARALAAKTASWTMASDGVWTTDAPAAPWAGFAKGRFLFAYKTPEDLTDRGPIMGVNRPGYGIAWRNGRLWVRLPDDADPHETPVIVTATKARNLVVIKDTPTVILDGLRFAGAGQTFAVDADEGSTHLEIRNCTAELCRMLASIPSNSRISWCRYHYPGFLEWAEEVAAMNGDSIEGVFTLCKRYLGENGNAPYEGRLATASGKAMHCDFDHNLIGPTFDGQTLGQFSHSASSFNVSIGCFDDHIEMEDWRSDRESRDLWSHRDVMINGFGSAVSVQDTAKQIRGHITVERAAILNPHPLAAPAYLIKLIGPYAHDPHINFDWCFFHNKTGKTGWGLKNWLFLDNVKAKGARLKIRNSVVYMPDGIDRSDAFSADCDWNIVVSDKPYPEIQGPNGRFIESIEALKLRDWSADIPDVRPNFGSPLLGAGEDGVTVGPYETTDELLPRPIGDAWTEELPAAWAA